MSSNTLAATSLSRVRPRALAWRPRSLDKVLRRIEKAVDQYRYRDWYADKRLTGDYTSGNFTNWRRILWPWRNEPLRILELGSYEGRSALFFLNFFPRATITCVDVFTDLAEVEARFDYNVKGFQGRVEKIKSVSFPALDRLAADGRRFDLVYIDADHRYDPVMADSRGAWQVTGPGAVVMWDDYRSGRWLPVKEQPGTAIDEFLRDHAGSHRVLLKRYQVIIERL
jgi:cephalosporin hydroxylase